MYTTLNSLDKNAVNNTTLKGAMDHKGVCLCVCVCWQCALPCIPDFRKLLAHSLLFFRTTNVEEIFLPSVQSGDSEAH